MFNPVRATCKLPSTADTSSYISSLYSVKMVNSKSAMIYQSHFSNLDHFLPKTLSAHIRQIQLFIVTLHLYHYSSFNSPTLSSNNFFPSDSHIVKSDGIWMPSLCMYLLSFTLPNIFHLLPSFQLTMKLFIIDPLSCLEILRSFPCQNPWRAF